MLEVVVSRRHDHADDDVDDKQHCAQRAPHARSLPLVFRSAGSSSFSRASRGR
jgi:hypothetical protein